MPSLRAKLVNMYLRRSMKSKRLDLIDPPVLRAMIEKNSIPLLPKGVSHEEVNEAGVRGEWRRPESGAVCTVLYLHGGGFRVGSIAAYKGFCSQLARLAQRRVLLIDYRLAPENTFPAALDDCVSAYRYLLDRGTPSSQVALAGDSAGGGLVLSVALATRAQNLDMPGAIAALSPWADLTNSNESYRTRGQADALFSLEDARTASEWYLAGHDPLDPLASPVFGELAGLPPLLIQVGDAEVLLDDAAAVARAAAEAGVEVRHRVFADMPHVWQLSYPAFPEAVEAMEEIAAFVRDHTG